jgi:hypothetical protein
MLVTTTTTASSTITAGPSITTSSTSSTTQQTSFQCYECSGPDCGKDGSSVSTNCPSCMVYRNPDDQSKKLEKFEKYSIINNINSKDRTTLLLVELWPIKLR